MSMGEFLLARDGYMMANGTYKQQDSLTWNDVLEEAERLHGDRS